MENDRPRSRVAQALIVATCVWWVADTALDFQELQRSRGTVVALALTLGWPLLFVAGWLHERRVLRGLTPEERADDLELLAPNVIDQMDRLRLLSRQYAMYQVRGPDLGDVPAALFGFAGNVVAWSPVGRWLAVLAPLAWLAAKRVARARVYRGLGWATPRLPFFMWSRIWVSWGVLTIACLFPLTVGWGDRAHTGAPAWVYYLEGPWRPAFLVYPATCVLIPVVAPFLLKSSTDYRHLVVQMFLATLSVTLPAVQGLDGNSVQSLVFLFLLALAHVTLAILGLRGHRRYQRIVAELRALQPAR